MLETRLSSLDWEQIEAALNTHGFAVTKQLLDAGDCADHIQLYENEALFRNRIIMSRHNFGRGEYQYFAYPLPDAVATLRRGRYPGLAAIANRWQTQLGLDARYPPTHDAYLEVCHAAGQTRPTPLILKYGPDDYNCLHQDLYGELAFPLQAAILLDDPDTDFDGGEFVLTEQRPRMQSRAEVVPLRRGAAVIFPVDSRPVEGSRGAYRVRMRHGVSRVRRGHRHTLGIIFHDAQ